MIIAFTSTCLVSSVNILIINSSELFYSAKGSLFSSHLIFHHSKAVVIGLRMKCILAVCMTYLLTIIAEEKDSFTIQCVYVCACRRCNNSGIATVTEFCEAVLYFAKWYVALFLSPVLCL